MRSRRNTAAAAMAIAIVVLAGCASNGPDTGLGPSGAADEDDTVELSFYYPVHVGGPLTPTIEGMAEQFRTDNPGIRIKPVYAGNYDETKVKVQAAVQGNNPPDVAIMQTTDLYGLLDMDAIVPLDPFIEREGGQSFLADFYPAFLANSRTGDKTYSIPFQRSTAVLYYNKNAFSRAGLDPKRPPTNWDELVSMSRSLTHQGQWGIEIPSSAPNISTWMFQLFAIQNGKTIISGDGKKVFFNSPENVEALQFWLDLAVKHKAMPSGIIDWETVPDDFVRGKTAMMVHTTGNLTNVKNKAAFDFGVSFLPGRKQFGTPTGGGNFYIFNRIGQRKQEAAWKFVKWMTDPDRIAQWSIDTGYVAVRESAYDTERMKAYVKRFPAALVARDQLAYAVPELSTHNNDKVTKALNDAVQSVLKGEQPPGPALQSAQVAADKALAPFNRP